MKILAITGSPAVGKSFITDCVKEHLEDEGCVVKVFDYDLIVKVINKNGGFNKFLNDKIPGHNFGENYERDMAFYRDVIIFGRPEKKILDSVVQPIMYAAYCAWLHEAEKTAHFVILDMPLLHEVAEDFEHDISWCIRCNEDIQHERLLKRGLSEDEANSIVKQQLTQDEKAKRSDFVFDAGDTEDVWDTIEPAMKMFDKIMEKFNS